MLYVKFVDFSSSQRLVFTLLVIEIWYRLQGMVIEPGSPQGDILFFDPADDSDILSITPVVEFVKILGQQVIAVLIIEYFVKIIIHKAFRRSCRVLFMILPAVPNCREFIGFARQAQEAVYRNESSVFIQQGIVPEKSFLEIRHSNRKYLFIPLPYYCKFLFIPIDFNNIKNFLELDFILWIKAFQAARREVSFGVGDVEYPFIGIGAKNVSCTVFFFNRAAGRGP